MSSDSLLALTVVVTARGSDHERDWRGRIRRTLRITSEELDELIAVAQSNGLLTPDLRLTGRGERLSQRSREQRVRTIAGAARRATNPYTEFLPKGSEDLARTLGPMPPDRSRRRDLA